MLEVKYEYSGKSFSLTPYDTKTEKDLLLLPMLSKPSLDDALRVCGVNKDIIDTLTNDEKVAMLYKLREISVGENINLKFTCTHCGTHTENEITIDNIIEGAMIDNPNIKDCYKEITENNLLEFINVDVDELDLDEYESLITDLKKSVTSFNFNKPIICQKCTKVSFIPINDPEFVIDNMSEDTLSSLYQTYNDLTYFGKYTKQDVDGLYPFERVILISLLNKTKEDMNQ